VKRDQSGRDIVTTNEGEPLRDITKLGKEEQSTSRREALSPAAFKSAVQTQLLGRPVQ
jgi:hypothetical protein